MASSKGTLYFQQDSHSIQGLGPDGWNWVSMNGALRKTTPSLLSDGVRAQRRHRVVEGILGCRKALLKTFPNKSLYIFPADICPASLDRTRAAVGGRRADSRTNTLEWRAMAPRSKRGAAEVA